MHSLLIGGVGLVKCRIRGGGGPAIVSVVTKLNPVIQSVGWLDDAPFKTVHLILRFGQAKSETFFQPIIKRLSELPVARELSAVECEAASRAGTLEDLFMLQTLRALQDTADRYNLSKEWLLPFSESLA